MNCPKCESRMYVMEQKTDGTFAYRRYKCRSCGWIIYTEEKEMIHAKNEISKLHGRYKQTVDR